jgi:hypothetical protein
MKNILVGFALWLALPCFVAAQTAAQTNIFDLAHSTSFAQYLMISQQYDLAAIEYERMTFMRPSSDSIKYNLLLAYRLSGKPLQATARYRQLYAQSAPLFVLKETCKSHIAASDLVGLKVLLMQENSLSPLEKDRFTLGLHFMNKERKKSYELVQSSPYFKNSKYNTLIESSLMLRQKNPWLSAGLSAVVPGLGKVYTGKWKDGVFAAIMVGTLGWRSYRLFKRKGAESVFGWVFGAATVGFYAGNVWGSYRAAQLYNYKGIHEKEQLMLDYLLND